MLQAEQDPLQGSRCRVALDVAARANAGLISM